MIVFIITQSRFASIVFDSDLAASLCLNTLEATQKGRQGLGPLEVRRVGSITLKEGQWSKTKQGSCWEEQNRKVSPQGH